MNVLKSIITILNLAGATAGLFWLGYWCFCRKTKIRKVRNALWFTLVLIVVVVMYVTQCEYVYPFERTVDLELYAVIEIPEEHTLSHPDWHAIYGRWGIKYSGSKWMDTESVSQPSRRGFDWPEMDFENHTYIVSYGQELVALTYNVWETMNYPIKTGAKDGHPVFGDAFEPNKVYIYEIEKMRIDHDP